MEDTIETKIGIIMGMNMGDDMKLQWLGDLYLRVFSVETDGLTVKATMMGFDSYREKQAHIIRTLVTSAYIRRGMKLKDTRLESAVALGELHFKKRVGNKAPKGFILDTLKTLARDGLQGETFQEKVDQFPAVGNMAMVFYGYLICKNIIDTNGYITGLKIRERKAAKDPSPSPYNKSGQKAVAVPTVPIRTAAKPYAPRTMPWRARVKVFNGE